MQLDVHYGTIARLTLRTEISNSMAIMYEQLCKRDSLGILAEGKNKNLQVKWGEIVTI